MSSDELGGLIAALVAAIAVAFVVGAAMSR